MHHGTVAELRGLFFSFLFFSIETRTKNEKREKKRKKPFYSATVIAVSSFTSPIPPAINTLFLPCLIVDCFPFSCKIFAILI